jgi:hypothetical protein
VNGEIMFKNRLKNDKGRKLCFSYKVLSFYVAIMTLSVFLTSCIERTNKYVEDYEYVWNLLESNYPYYRYIENEGVDIEDVKERYSNEVINVDNEESFAEVLSRMFDELGGLDHLSVVDNYTYIGYWSVLNSVGFGNERIDTAFRKRLTSKKLAPRYSLQNSKELDVNREDMYPQVEIQYIEDINTLLLKIPSFSQDLIDRDKDVLVKAFADYPKTENVIFDISGNSGGSDKYWIENLVEPFGGSYEQKSILYFKESDLTEEYLGKDMLSDIASLENVPKCVLELNLDKYIDNRLSVSGETKIKSNCKDIEKWVLISGNTYSSADSFAQFCKDTNWACLVGDSTGGAGGGMTPILELLPNSGLVVRFAIDVVIDDEKLNAVEGTSPDIQCIKNETTLDKCIEQIRQDRQAGL